VILPQEAVEAIWSAIEGDPTTSITVDLETRTVSYGSTSVAFELDDYTRWRLMEGLDDIGLTLKHTDAIDSFEAKRPSYKPKTLPIRI
jgi:3-isopropylmalate/(R)-2-methylmalate dehydratase small subunit